MMKSTWRMVVGLLAFWVIILLYMSTTLYQSSDNERTERQLAKALQELDALKRQNDELQTLANELKDISLQAGSTDTKEYKRLKARLEEANRQLEHVAAERKRVDGSIQPAGKTDTCHPSTEHEWLRRKVENGVKEWWYYMGKEFDNLRKMAGDQPPLLTKLSHIIEDSHDHQRVILNDVYNLSMSSGHGEWRRQESEDLSALVQQRIHHNQNPEDCSAAQKLLCNLNKGCGYGCQIHHLIYCFNIALGTGRMLVLDSRGWRYSPGGWEKVFKPLSDKCTDQKVKAQRTWGPPDVIKSVKMVELPIVDSLHPRPPFMPNTIPDDIGERIVRLHGAPGVWWIGQLLKYVLRPQPRMEKEMEATKLRLKFKNPIVGVHVRRTDKVGTEAAFHSIDEYMSHVNDYYDLLEKRKPVDKRRVYLATDEPTLLAEATNKFPDYEFISDNTFSQSAGLGSRYSDHSLHGIIMDIHLLSLTDYLVCTFSSQVCRLAYEIMQTLHPDASDYFHSLDDVYYFGGQNAHNQIVRYPHQARTKEEIDLHIGDLIGIAGNHWDGYSKGINRRQGKTGLYPSYKVEDVVEMVKFPPFPPTTKDKALR